MDANDEDLEASEIYGAVQRAPRRHDRHRHDHRSASDHVRPNFAPRSVLGVQRADILDAHMRCKQRLIEHINSVSDGAMSPDVLTFGFARRAATYKRADLLFTDIERLRKIAAGAGALQIVYAGKAHPADQAGKEVIQRVIEHARTLRPAIKAVYLEDYDMALGAMVTAGVDVWLNTPSRRSKLPGPAA